MSDYEFHTLKDFSGGQNTTDAPDELLENQLIACENVDFTGHGGVKPRKGIVGHTRTTVPPFSIMNNFAIIGGEGYENIGTTYPAKYYQPPSAACIYRLLELEKNSYTEEQVPITQIYRAALTNAFSWYGNCQFTIVPNTNVVEKYEEPVFGLFDGNNDLTPDGVASFHAEPHLSYEVYKDNAYILIPRLFWARLNELAVFNGTNFYQGKPDIPTPEDSNHNVVRKCKYIAQRGERMFAAGNPDDPNALYFSEVGDPTYFKTDNIIQAISDDGDIITGIKEFHGALLVFKSRSIYAWFGYDPMSDVEFQRLAVHTGTKAYRTIQQVGNYLFYLGNDGVYALQGTYKDVISTRKISNQINKIFANDIQIQYPHRNSFWFHPACATYYDNKYMIAVPEVVDEEYIMEAVPNDLPSYFFLPFPIVATKQDIEVRVFDENTNEYITRDEYCNRYNGVYPFNSGDIRIELGVRTSEGGAYTYGFIFLYNTTDAPVNIKIKYKRVKTTNIAVLDTSIAQDVFGSDYLPWTMYKGLDVTEFLKSCDGNLYFAVRGSTNLYRFDDVYSDDGQPINVAVETKPLSTGAYAHNKKFKNLYMTFEPLTNAYTEIDIGVKVDDSESLFSVPWYDQKEKTLLRRLVVNKKGKRIKYRYSYACNENPVILLGLTTQYKIKKPARE